jgi:hypothetical protein
MEFEMIHEKTIFQDRAVVLLLAKFDGEDIDVSAGDCGDDYQLKRVSRRASVCIGGERK